MIAENGAEDAAFLPRGRLSPDDETARSRIARSLFVLSTRGLDAFVSPEGRFRDGRAGATPWAGVGADDGGARRSRQASAARTAATAPIALGAMPAHPFSWSKNGMERLSYRRFQCRAADSVLSVAENKGEQVCPQTESVFFKKLG